MATGLFISKGGTATTCISREGKDFKVSKYIPIDYSIQLKSKFITVFIINFFSLIVIGAVLIILKASPLLFVLSLIVVASTTILISFLGMYWDFRSPNLEWEDERQMFKKNYMPVITLFLMMIVGGIYIGISFVIKKYLVIFLLIIIINTIISTALYKKIRKLAQDIYSN